VRRAQVLAAGLVVRCLSLRISLPGNVCLHTQQERRKKAEEGEAGAAGAAGNGAGIPAAGQGRTFWAGQAEASLSIDREEGTANGIGTVFVQRISGPLSSVVVVAVAVVVVAVAVVVVCSHKGSYPAFVIVVCDFSHFAK